MNKIAAFIKLIRSANLLFIIITQVLFKFFIVDKVFAANGFPHPIAPSLFWLLCLASVLIAAAGYMINDYFDLNIDSVNKPDKLIVDKIISRRWTIFLHLLFSVTGIAISVYIGKNTNYLVTIGNTICVVLLWFYSTTFKKQLLIGNIIISLLTAWVILVVYLAIYPHNQVFKLHNYQLGIPLHKLFKFLILYSSYAFIISLVREVVKDIEDMKGDARYGCVTMPVKWGIPVSKVFVAVWVGVLAASLVAILFYILQLGWWLAAIYLFLLVFCPLIYVIKELYEARAVKEYHKLSIVIKLVMLTGILSMIFMSIYI